jgi:hypothetical protein
MRWIRLGDMIRTGFLSPDECADLIASATELVVWGVA